MRNDIYSRVPYPASSRFLEAWIYTLQKPKKIQFSPEPYTILEWTVKGC